MEWIDTRFVFAFVVGFVAFGRFPKPMVRHYAFAARQAKLTVSAGKYGAYPLPTISDIVGLHFCPKSFSFGPAAHVAFSLTIRFGNVNSCSMTISELDYQRMLARTELERDKLSGRDKIAPVGACESERQLHFDILAECRRRGWIAIHARMDLPATVPVGCPDFVIFADHPRVFIIEGKSLKGKLSEKQVAMLGWFTGLGWNVEIVRSFEQFLTLIAAERESLTTPPVPAQTPS